MSKPDRMRRVNELLKREIADLFERDISPGLPGLISVTKVDTAPNLRHSNVYFSLLGKEVESKAGSILTMLKAKRADFQRELAHRVKLKYTPVLSFKYDNTIALGDSVLGLIDQIEHENDNHGEEE